MSPEDEARKLALDAHYDAYTRGAFATTQQEAFASMHEWNWAIKDLGSGIKMCCDELTYAEARQLAEWLLFRSKDRA